MKTNVSLSLVPSERTSVKAAWLGLPLKMEEKMSGATCTVPGGAGAGNTKPLKLETLSRLLSDRLLDRLRFRMFGLSPKFGGDSRADALPAGSADA